MRIPRHIGVIPDGNRRWAVQHGLQKHEGYEYGLAPGLALLRQAREQGVEEISYYGFTVENCKRPLAQQQAFCKACVDAFSLLAAEPVDMLVVGNADSPCFPQALAPYTQRTALNGGGLKVNFLVNYGWEWDLFDAKGRRDSGVWHSRDVSRVDLVIRWGGMRRLSGFLPIQSVYADFYVVGALWPDYTPQHLTDALAWYDAQDVTLGG